ncbi:uncharacterized protein BXIN_1135 [Babesia sp. Xinjiang]|uniref:uncharacterized protein n=1 Tax=Babesia sp. Xinjiang TaxID=462227 RepID=UPI000A22CF78|nr:uncharacterized protein BXIN_1135 [Babesia sp. Xinjiang]ORM42347.1 hypothetical protein BXIN_1135 [Babesia sp. Xinjiang]
MFFIEPQTVGCCAVGCCAIAATSYLANNISKIPHPSECGCIGGIYRIVGLHSHDPFDIILEIHEAHSGIDSGKYYVEVEAGRKTYRTQTVSAKDGQLHVHEKLRVHVRQCDDAIFVKLYKQQLMRDHLCGELKLSATHDLMAEKPAKRRWFTMVHENHSATRMKVSIYRMSEEVAARELSPLMLQAIIEAEQDGKSIEEDLIEELERMDDYAKLRFYSKVISGPLKKMNTFGRKWTTLYFKPLEISNGNWEWCAWNTREDYDAGLEAIETYPFLSISVVVADPTNSNCFYVKYHKDGGDFGLLFKRVDRNRDVWADSLYEFIERTREIYFKNPNKGKLKISHKNVKRCKDFEANNHKLGSDHKQAEMQFHLSKFKRLVSPVQRVDDENKLHQHVGRMAQHMYMPQ